MITNEVIECELNILKKVLNYNGLTRTSKWNCLWPGVGFFLWIVLWPLVSFGAKLSFNELASEERLGLFISIVAVFILGFTSLFFSFSSKVLYLSIPSGFRLYSTMYSLLVARAKVFLCAFLMLYLVSVAICTFIPFGVVFFPLILVSSIIVLSMAINRVFYVSRLHMISSTVLAFKHAGRFRKMQSDEGCESININEHNPATGLPMVGGVDVGGNPYGYSRHDCEN